MNPKQIVYHFILFQQLEKMIVLFYFISCIHLSFSQQIVQKVPLPLGINNGFTNSGTPLVLDTKKVNSEQSSNGFIPMSIEPLTLGCGTVQAINDALLMTHISEKIGTTRNCAGDKANVYAPSTGLLLTFARLPKKITITYRTEVSQFLGVTDATTELSFSYAPTNTQEEEIIQSVSRRVIQTWENLSSNQLYLRMFVKLTSQAYNSNNIVNATIQITSITFDITPNEYEITAPLVAPVAPVLSYGDALPNQNIDVSIELEDQDNGTIFLEKVGGRDFTILKPFPVDNMQGKTKSTYLLTVQYQPQINGPPAQVFNLIKRNERNNNGKITFNINNSKSPGGTWSNLILWLKSDYGIVNSNKKVTLWEDFSGYERKMKQVQFAKQPLLAENALNFNKALIFNNSQSLTITEPTLTYDKTQQPKLTIFSVAIPSSKLPQAIWGNEKSNLGRGRTLLSTLQHPNSIGGSSIGYSSINTNLFKESEAVIIKVSYDTGVINGSTVSLNGVIIHYFTENNDSQSANPWQIGANGNNSYFFSGILPELMIYENSFDTNPIDEKRINSYLAIKYGITLAHEYYNSKGTIIYAQLENYSNNIVGIGSDSQSTLHQPKSRSINPHSVLTIENNSLPTTTPTYFIVGNNGESLALNNENTPNRLSKINRIWFVSNNNNLDNTTITFHREDFPWTKFSSMAPSSFSLLLSSSKDFSASIPIEASAVTKDLITFNSMLIPNESRMTLGVQTFSIEGHIFINFDQDTVKANRTLTMLRNGIEIAKTTTDNNGKYQFSLPNTPNNTQLNHFLIFIDDEEDKGACVFNFVNATDNIIDLDIYINHLSIHSKTNQDATDNLSDFIVSNDRIIKAIGVNIDADIRSLFSINYLSKALIFNEKISVFISKDAIYRPEADLSQIATITILGDLSLEHHSLSFTQDWRHLSGDFKVTTGKVLALGKSNKVFGNNSFYNFEKKLTLPNSILFFEKNKINRFENDIRLEGKINEKLFIRTMDENGLLKNSIICTIETLNSTKVTINNVNVRDNIHRGANILEPANSANAGNNQNWFFPTVFWDKPVFSSGEGNANVIVKLRLSDFPKSPVRLSLKILSSSTAEQNEDYSNIMLDHSFAITEKEKNISIPIIDDDIYESDEYIIIKIDEQALVNARTESSEYKLNILDNDPLPILSLSKDTFEIKEQGATQAKISVIVEGKTTQPISASIVFSGEAKLGEDFISIEKITFDVNEPKQKDFFIKAIDDQTREQKERIFIQLTELKNVQKSASLISETLVILDNESLPLITLSASKLSLMENNQSLVIQVSVIENTFSPITVDLTLLGNAILNTDYKISSTSLLIPKGETHSNIIKLESIDNQIPAFTKIIEIKVLSLVNAATPNNDGVSIKIIDDEPDLQNSVMDASPFRILGNGSTTSTISLQLKNIEGTLLDKMGGIITFSTSSGIISEALYSGNGKYTARLTSDISSLTPIVAIVTSSIDGKQVKNNVSVIFEIKQDKDNDSIYDYCECPNLQTCPDTDGDGLPNQIDVDSDNDGLSDNDECSTSTTCFCPDTDGDGIPNYLEHNFHDWDQDNLEDFRDKDSDNDGKDDGYECDASGICADFDNDGIIDKYDADDNINAQGGDTDRDTIPDLIECGGVNNCVDSDKDGIPDFFDTDADNNNIPDIEQCPNGKCIDCDNDGIHNIIDDDDDNNGILDEVELSQYNIDANTDTDGDGIANLCDDDDDGDGIDDKVECAELPCDIDRDLIPNYLDTDSDGDSLKDKYECSTPNNCEDTDNDGLPDFMDTDADNDTKPDIDECIKSDGLTCLDTDSDGTPNFRDLDSDNDGLTDIQETYDDCDGDGIPAFLDTLDYCIDQIIPKTGIFTPNWDGVNDYWYIENIEKFPNNKVIVFNRNGEIVFDIEGYQNNRAEKRWNGLANSSLTGTSKVVIAGTYLFIIDLFSIKEKVSGYVMVNKK